MQKHLLHVDTTLACRTTNNIGFYLEIFSERADSIDHIHLPASSVLPAQNKQEGYLLVVLCIAGSFKAKTIQGIECGKKGKDRKCIITI